MNADSSGGVSGRARLSLSRKKDIALNLKVERS